MIQKNNARISYSIVLLSLLFALLIATILSSLLKVLLPNISTTDLSLISMSISTLFVGLPVIVYLRLNKLHIRERLRINAISKYSLLYIIIISIGIIILIDELDRIVYLLFGSPDFLEDLVYQLKITTIYNGLLIVFTTVVLAPAMEELLFRGYLQKVLEESWEDITKAILVTSLFFALAHLNPYWIVQIYLLGFVLGYLAWSTNSILPGIILHGLNNGFAVALNNADDVFNTYYLWHEHVNPVWIITAIIFVILGFNMLNKDLEKQS